MNPFFMIRPQPQPLPSPYHTPPARVQIAMQFLSLLSQKTTKIAASSDVRGLEVEDGQSLTAPEIAAQESACELLGNYFDGSLEPCPYDGLPQQPQRQCQHHQQPVLKCPCFLTNNGSPFPGCAMCNGTGELQV